MMKFLKMILMLLKFKVDKGKHTALRKHAKLIYNS